METYTLFDAIIATRYKNIRPSGQTCYSMEKRQIVPSVSGNVHFKLTIEETNLEVQCAKQEASDPSKSGHCYPISYYTMIQLHIPRQPQPQQSFRRTSRGNQTYF